MGRKRGLPARAREKLVAEEAASSLEIGQKEAVLKGKPNESLFVVDAVGSKGKRRKLQKEAKAPKYLSKNEKKIIVHKYLGKAGTNPVQPKKRISDPWVDDHDNGHVPNNNDPNNNDQSNSDHNRKEEEKEGLHQSDKLALPPSASKKGTGGDTINTAISSTAVVAAGAVAAAEIALMEERKDSFMTLRKRPGHVAAKKRRKPTTRDLAKLGVCHSGQSYNPTEDDHDDVLASAVAVELRRQEAVEDEKKPVSVGMSKETLDVLVGDEDDDLSDDDDDNDGDDNGGVSLGKLTPATGKLTRTQRNKQKRVKEAAYKLKVKRSKKEMFKSIDKVTVLQQEVAEQERLREERRQTKSLFKAQKARQEAEGANGHSLFGPSAGVVAMDGKRAGNRDIIAGRSVPVNLGEELHGSLRQIRAQGSVLMDKVELLKASKAHPDRRHGKDRAKKAHKGFRKKHTYKDRYKDD